MSVALTPWGAKARELLADGKWHDREELLGKVALVVPPGRAFRIGERTRNRAIQRPNGPGPRVHGDDSTSIAAGARHVARSTLESMVKRGTAERDGDRIRLLRP